ncbi:AAA family ATPase [Candidatus Sumerlaeota bacterium]|nr:AAA family ATPase [Candidatus Sumerlaeota bacterium]
MNEMKYEFLKKATTIINSGQTRILTLCGNIFDLFYLPAMDLPREEKIHNPSGKHVPLISFLSAKWKQPGKAILVIYELNGPIRFEHAPDKDKMKEAWILWKTGMSIDELAIQGMYAHSREQVEKQKVLSNLFDTMLENALGNPTQALEFLRQMCLCSRSKVGNDPCLREDLIIVVEGAHMLIPEAPVAHISDADRQRITVCHDWFSDPGFLAGDDSVILIAESRSLIHHQLNRLPQVLEVEIPSPDEMERLHFIEWFDEKRPADKKLRLWGTQKDLAKFTAGLSIMALYQILMGACYKNEILMQRDVVNRVEEFIQQQLGEDIVEFKKPRHNLKDVIGFTNLKKFLMEEILPRFQSTGKDALPGAAVSGPIGSGKTFIFEALAAELDMVVLTLKNIRSMWYGQTDVIFERLRRVLNALDKAMIFMDEADTQMGGVGPETHDTERRLTGKIQAMMSDPALRGRIVWLLMTARIHLLSPDLRRPGRVGDLIIPVLDPQGDDRTEFIRWMISPVLEEQYKMPVVEQNPTAVRKTKKSKASPASPHDDASQKYQTFMDKLQILTASYSAASFASMRSELLARAKGKTLSLEEILAIIHDHIPPAIEETRRYQTLQALVNCTRRSLLPDPNITEETRNLWAAEIREMELRGIR